MSNLGPPISEYPEDLPFSVEEIEKGKSYLTKRLEAPVWTASKANIIKLYLDLFVKVTFRGAYIDAFAGHQYKKHQEFWAARLAWEGNPGAKRKRIDRFELFEQNATSYKNLCTMVKNHPADGRLVETYFGDCNILVPEMLEKRPIRGPAFCLLDQRTTECTWELVKNIAKHKTEGTKIEIFYFLMAKWKGRSLNTRGAERDGDLQKWWGRDDYDSLFNASHEVIKDRFVERFQDELGYSFVRGYPIADRSAQVPGGGIHYYMIHASDNPEAPKFMVRSYNKTAGGYNPYSIQPTLAWSEESENDIKAFYRKGKEVRRRK